MPITDVFVKNAKAKAAPKKHSDGGGLHLLVTEQGSKLWRLSYRYENKQKTLALGAYPTITLSAARMKQDAAKNNWLMALTPLNS